GADRRTRGERVLAGAVSQSAQADFVAIGHSGATSVARPWRVKIMPATQTSVGDLLQRALAGDRLSLEDGMRLYEEADADELRQAADAIRVRRHPEGVVTYLVDRNINYTNVCIIDCGFCAFYRKPASPEGYLLSNEEIGKKIEELQAWGGTRILLQGGVH